jgi:hypothetical protein
MKPPLGATLQALSVLEHPILSDANSFKAITRGFSN